MSAEPRFIVAVAVVLTSGQRVLALRRSAHKDVGAGIWETISGRVQGDETLEDAARRELFEETGQRALELRGPLDAYRMMRGEIPMVVVVYQASTDSENVSLSIEHDAFAWLTLQEAQERMPHRLVEAVRRAMQAAR